MNDITNRMEIVELMQFKENTVLVRTHGQHKNIALHCTEAGLGQAFLVASVSGEEDAEFGIMPGPGDTRLLLPASTGIGANTPSGASASMDLLAVVEKGDRTSPEEN